jgi:hypothetical protein
MPRVSSVHSVFRRIRFNDFVDGVCVVQFLDLEWDADHNFLSEKKNCNLITCHFFLADGHGIKLALESESCPLNLHLAGNNFCATRCYVTHRDVHNVIEPFLFHS